MVCMIDNYGSAAESSGTILHIRRDYNRFMEPLKASCYMSFEQTVNSVSLQPNMVKNKQINKVWHFSKQHIFVVSCFEIGQN